MVFGDGDGEIFNRFTIAIDVVAHELSHGVTESEAGLSISNNPARSMNRFPMFLARWSSNINASKRQIKQTG